MRQVLARLAAMQGEELRFRGLCEVRKLAGRVGTTLSPPVWRRNGLDSRLVRRHPSPEWPAIRAGLHRGDYRAAHASLAAHWRQRRSPFPIDSLEVPARARVILDRFPSAQADAVSRADAVLAGRYQLLGYSELELGPVPDWHADPVHQRRAPERYWALVPHLDPAIGDHKIIWELNRHQHWLVLGRAFALSGERRFYDAFTRQLADWLRANPPLTGANWASMLELAFRILSWIWALEMFCAEAGESDTEPWLVDLLLAIDRQLVHVEENLSYYFSPNTHLTGEALALYVAGLALPELRRSERRADIGRRVLLREAVRQVRADGGHAELSGHYHRYSTDFYLLAALVAGRANDPAASSFLDAAAAQARYLRTICSDAGERPQIGDDDGGQLFPICGTRPEDCRDTLATAALVTGQAALSVGEAPEETYWMCGARAASIPVDSTRWSSAALTASGYYVSRTTRGDHLILDAGPHGYLNAGHAHADALACTLVVAGRPLLIDPGTATYTMWPELRDRFRSTMMHNTVALNDRSQSEPRGPFHWKTMTSAEAPVWRSAADCDYVEATHAGYAPARHTRAVLALHGLGWWFLDHLLNAPHRTAAAAYWHFHPGWRASLERSSLCRLTSEQDVLCLASTSPLTVLAPGSDPLAMRAPAYGRLEPAPVAVARHIFTGSDTIATFIPAMSELADQLSIDALEVSLEPGSGWLGRGFRVRWRGGAMTLLAALEQDGVAARDTAAPPGRWGTPELQTDARLACVIDRTGAASEVLLVNGAFVSSAPGAHLVSLARPVPLLRWPAGAVAPGMHEVGK